MKNMKKIPSFQKDHNTLQPGLHNSGTAHGVTTWDVRFKKPNANDFITPKALHSIEHMLATALRNSEYGERIVYFGPMGCRTGFYLLTVGMDENEVLGLLRSTLETAQEMDEVPGSKKEECGNYTEHDLDDAKEECRKYAKLLEELYNI